MQYRYFGSGAHMSADLKAVTRRVRAARPELFRTSEQRGPSSMDDEGKVHVVVRNEAKATAMRPAVRHALATKKV